MSPVTIRHIIGDVNDGPDSGSSPGLAASRGPSLLHAHLPHDLQRFPAGRLTQEAVDRLLEYDDRFIAAVEEGRASARRGDMLEHDEVVEQIEQMFRS